MFKKSIALFSILTLVTISFSGCFRKEKPPETPTGKVELTYYKLFDEEDVIMPLIQQYTASHPNVTIKYRKFVDPIEYQNLIVNELAEGEGPDIFSAPNHWFLRNNKKLTGIPEDLMSVAQFNETFVSTASKDLILVDSRDNKRKIFGIPLTVDSLALYYNKAAYEDAIPERGKPASTWEELKEDVFKLSKKDNSFERFQVAGMAMGRADNIGRAIDILYLLMLQNNAAFYDDNVANATFTKGTGSKNPAAEALKLYTSFSLPAQKNYSWNQYLASADSPVKEMETFARGKVAMIFGYSYLYEQIKDQIKLLKDKGVKVINESDIRIATVPQINDPATSTEKRDTYANYFAETVSRNSKYPREAWDFLLFISSKENLQFYNEKTNKPTSRRDLIEEQKKNPIYGVFAEQIGFAESFPIYDEEKYKEIFSKSIDDVLATTSAENAMRIAEESINVLLPTQGLVAKEVVAEE